MEKTFEELFPIMDVAEGIILSKQGDMTIVFRAELPEIFTLSDEEYETLHQSEIKAIRVLKPGMILHKQDWFLRSTYHQEARAGDSWLNQCSQRYFDGRPQTQHDCYFMLTLKPAKRLSATSMLSSLISPTIVPAETQNIRMRQEFIDIAMRFKRLLEDSKLIRLTLLNTDDLLSSPRRAGLIERYCYLTDNPDQGLYQDIRLDEPIRIGQQQLTIYTLGDAADLPSVCGPRIDYDRLSTDKSRFPISFAANLGLLLPVNHIYNQYILIGDAQATLKQMEKKRLRLQSLAAYSRANAISLAATNEFLNEAISQQRLPVKAHFNIMAWTDKVDELPAIRNQVASALAAMDASAKPETIGAAQLWWAGIPGNSAELPLNDTFDTFAEQACCFLNQESNYRGAEPGTGIRFCDRLNRTPVYADLFDAPRQQGITSNMGMLVCGSSGGGKSMTINHVLRSLYDQGAHCVTVDIGGSYLGLCEALKGYYYTFTEEKPISFNPFYIKSGDVLDTEKKESLKALLVALWKQEYDSFSRSEYVALSNALQGYYDQLRQSDDFPSFDHFYEYLENVYREVLGTQKVKEKDFDLDNFLYVLRPYAHDGEFAYLLNARENLDLLEQPFIVIELDNIKDHPILFPVVTLIIMELFISKMRKLKGVRKVLTIDEAWKAIAKAGMAEFLKYAFKTIRKFNGVPIVISQELDDLISSPIIKDAIINNADIKILMDMRKFQHKIEQIQGVLGLSEKAKTILLSVSKEDREIFIDLGGQQQKVYRNELCPEEYYTYTTEGKERVLVLELAAQHGSIQKGIEALIQNKSIGL